MSDIIDKDDGNENEIDNDLVVDPLKQSKIDVKKDFNVDGMKSGPVSLNPDEPTINDGPLGQNIPNELPNFEGEFKIVTDGASKVVSFKEVEDQIMNGSKVGQEHALLIDNITGDFLSTECLSLNSFTKSPTRVNLDKTIKFLKKKIATEDTAIKDSATSLISVNVKITVDAIKSFIATSLESLLYELDSLPASTSDALDHIFSSTNRVVSLGNDFIDFSHISLIPALDIGENNRSSQSNSDICRSISNLSDVVAKGALVKVLLMLKANKPKEEFFSSTAEVLLRQEMVYEVTFNDIDDMIQNKSLKSMVEYIYSQLSDENADFSKQIATVLATMENPSTDGGFSKLLIENRDIFKSVMQNLHYMYSLQILLPLFIKAYKETIDSIAKVV